MFVKWIDGTDKAHKKSKQYCQDHVALYDRVMSQIQILYTVRSNTSQAWWHMLVVSAVGKLRQGNHHELETLNYTMSSMTAWAIYQDLACLKNQIKPKQSSQHNSVCDFWAGNGRGMESGKDDGNKRRGKCVCVYACTCTCVCLDAEIQHWGR